MKKNIFIVFWICCVININCSGAADSNSTGKASTAEGNGAKEEAQQGIRGGYEISTNLADFGVSDVDADVGDQYIYLSYPSINTQNGQ